MDSALLREPLIKSLAVALDLIRGSLDSRMLDRNYAVFDMPAKGGLGKRPSAIVAKPPHCARNDNRYDP